MGLPINSMVIFYGYVSHNQMVPFDGNHPTQKPFGDKKVPSNSHSKKTNITSDHETLSIIRYY